MCDEKYPMVENQMPAGPRPFSEIPRLWLKVFEMTADFFAEEMHHASVGNTLINVLIYALIVTVISVVASSISFLSGIGDLSAYSGIGAEWFAQVGAMSLLYVACCGLIMIPIGFYLGNGLIYLGARVFHGRGDFTTQVYLQSLFSVPLGMALSVLSSVSSLIPPSVGSCGIGFIAVVTSIYMLILNVLAVKVTHGISSRAAVGAVLLFPFLFLLVVPVCLIVVLRLLGPAIGDIFENIITNIQ